MSFGGAATYGVGLAQFIVFPLSPELGRQAFKAATDGGGVPLQTTGGSAVLVGTPMLNAVIARGERDAARQLLTPIYEWFTEGFDTLDLREAKTLLDGLA